MVRENREALHLVAMQLFWLTPSGARVLVKLLETGRTSREALHVALSRASDPASDIKIVDVAICSMRKRLEKFGIEIATLWAYGFRLSSEHRRRAMDLILAAAPRLIGRLCGTRPAGWRGTSMRGGGFGKSRFQA